MSEKAYDLPALTLAYIGDAVFELYTRRYIAANYNLSVNKMNERAQSTVNAASQANMARHIIDKLTNDEAAVLKRGRNAKAKTVPRNADMIDYRLATGLEALFGYLYLTGDIKRIGELFDLCVGG